jgi:hypothetical protein
MAEHTVGFLTIDALVDALVIDPKLNMTQLANQLGVKYAWVTRTVKTREFKRRLSERREDFKDPMLEIEIKDRLRLILKRSLDVIEEKLKGPTNRISNNFVIKAAEFSSKSLGIGVEDYNGGEVHVDLEDLKDRLVNLQRNKEGIYVEQKTIEQSGNGHHAGNAG